MTTGPVERFSIARGNEVQVSARARCAIVGARLFVRESIGWILTSCEVGVRQCLSRPTRPELGGLELGTIVAAEEIRAVATYTGDADRAAFLGFIVGERPAEMSEMTYTCDADRAALLGLALGDRSSPGSAGPAEWVPLEVTFWADGAVNLVSRFSGDADVVVRSIVFARDRDWLVEDVRIDERPLIDPGGYLPAVALGFPQELDCALGVATRELSVTARPILGHPRDLLVEVEAEVFRVPRRAPSGIES